MARYAVFYQKRYVSLRGIPTHFEFFDNYAYMGVHEAENLDELFHNLNEPMAENNPLAYPHADAAVLQNTVVRLAGHTSMSVGDVAIELGTRLAWVCTSSGWVEAHDVSKNCLTHEELASGGRP